MMKLYRCCIKCNGTKITSFKSEQFLKVKGSSAMTFLWQGVCRDMEYGGCTQQCSCIVRGRGSSLLTEDIHHCCTSSFWFTADSVWVYSSTYCSFHPALSAWLLLEETQICSCFGGNPAVWHGLGASRASDNRKAKSAENQLNYLQSA